MKTTLIIISFVTNRAERMENNALWQTNGKKRNKNSKHLGIHRF